MGILECFRGVFGLYGREKYTGFYERHIVFSFCMDWRCFWVMVRDRSRQTGAKNRICKFRLSNEEEKKLNDLRVGYGLTKSEIIRKGIEIQYNLFRIANE